MKLWKNITSLGTFSALWIDGSNHSIWGKFYLLKNHVHSKDKGEKNDWKMQEWI